MTRSRSRSMRGFSLIEISIVLVVIGLIISGGLLAVAPVIQGGKVNESKGKLDRIEQALTLYVIQNGCLPCPADGSLTSTSANAGWSEDSTNAAFYGPSAGAPNNRPCSNTGCTTSAGAATAMGVVPWKTLGLSEADILDAWAGRVSYAVTSNLTTTVASSMVRGSPAIYPVGTITVNNNAATPRTQTTAAAYVLISHGPDRAWAFTPSGTNNADPHGSGAGDPQFINSPANYAASTVRQDEVSGIEAATYFDDIVRWRTAAIIIQSCGSNACGNPS